jgi:hypothetical protein
MINFEVSLKTVEDVKKFTSIALKVPDEVIVKSGKYVADGKSLLGIFSLDLSKPIIVEVSKKEYEDLFFCFKFYTF